MSRAISSSTSPAPTFIEKSLSRRHYQYDFQTRHISTVPSLPETTDVEDRRCYASSPQYTKSRDLRELEPSFILPATLSFSAEGPLLGGGATVRSISKRSKSASAARGRGKGRSKRSQGQSQSATKKKSKYYQQRSLTPEEIDLREALRIVDLDNIGFFPPSELRKVLHDIGIDSNAIGKIERCLPLDDDGHYSMDNLIQLFLGTNE